MTRRTAALSVLASLLLCATAPSRASAQEPATPPPPVAGPITNDQEPTTPLPPPSGPTTNDQEPTTPSTPDLGTFGIGLLLGQPIGATAKVFLAPAHALQFGLGYDLVMLDAAIVTVDYVWHPTSIFGNSVFELTWHVGIGGSLGVWPVGSDYDCRDADPVLEGVQAQCRTAWVQPGVRVPLGLEMIFRDFPLELFVEFAPGVIAYPMVEFLGQGGFGARWYL
ncbi:MAG: hypothetical protein HY905_22075 [Deltaproteobacteria bacterium]|nr:hypothetical protein [Deltaproteobacteria bacterium]